MNLSTVITIILLALSFQPSFACEPQKRKYSDIDREPNHRNKFEIDPTQQLFTQIPDDIVKYIMHYVEPEPSETSAKDLLALSATCKAMHAKYNTDQSVERWSKTFNISPLAAVAYFKNKKGREQDTAMFRKLYENIFYFLPDHLSEKTRSLVKFSGLHTMPSTNDLFIMGSYLSSVENQNRRRVFLAKLQRDILSFDETFADNAVATIPEQGSWSNSYIAQHKMLILKTYDPSTTKTSCNLKCFADRQGIGVLIRMDMDIPGRICPFIHFNTIGLKLDGSYFPLSRQDFLTQESRNNS